MDGFILVRPIMEADHVWIEFQTSLLWESPEIVTRGQKYDVRSLPGFMAIQNKEPAGFLVYNIAHGELEIIALMTTVQEKGVGTALIKKAIETARSEKCTRVWVITTNDNLPSLRFYQKRGFHLKMIYPDAIEKSRYIKPQIPATGMFHIPLRDEIELDVTL